MHRQHDERQRREKHKKYCDGKNGILRVYISLNSLGLWRPNATSSVYGRCKERGGGERVFAGSYFAYFSFKYFDVCTQQVRKREQE